MEERVVVFLVWNIEEGVGSYLTRKMRERVDFWVQSQINPKKCVKENCNAVDSSVSFSHYVVVKLASLVTSCRCQKQPRLATCWINYFVPNISTVFLTKILPHYPKARTIHFYTYIIKIRDSIWEYVLIYFSYTTSVLSPSVPSIFPYRNVLRLLQILWQQRIYTNRSQDTDKILPWKLQSKLITF